MDSVEMKAKDLIMNFSQNSNIQVNQNSIITEEEKKDDIYENNQSIADYQLQKVPKSHDRHVQRQLQ